MKIDIEIYKIPSYTHMHCTNRLNPSAQPAPSAPEHMLTLVQNICEQYSHFDLT